MRAAGPRLASLLYPALEGVRRLHSRGAKERGRRRFRRCEAGLDFSPATSEFNYEEIEVGRNVFIGPWAYFSGRLVIGDDVLIGPMVHITDGYHEIELPGSAIRDSGDAPKAGVVIEDDVWIGGRSTLMRGVRIGEGAVIGASSLVLHDVPPYTVAFGAPARPQRRRFDDEQLRVHLAARGRSQQRIDALVARRASELAERGHVASSP